MNKIIGIILIISAVLCHGKREHFHFRGPSIPPPPPYFDEVNGTACMEYLDIITNKSLTIAQQKKDVQAWAAKYDITGVVSDYNTNMTKMMEEARKNVTELINKLPTVLQMAYEIMDNEGQTVSKQRRAYANLSAQYPKEYRVIEYTFQQFLSNCGCGGEHDGRGKSRGPQPPELEKSNNEFVADPQNGDEIEVIDPVSPNIARRDRKGKVRGFEDYSGEGGVAE
uniref:ANIS5_cation-bd domain-containing protein n=1 Tax=Haemonchus contortus TaxID=6289 RepID=A0A7I5EA48_HAECO